MTLIGRTLLITGNLTSSPERMLIHAVSGGRLIVESKNREVYTYDPNEVSMRLEPELVPGWNPRLEPESVSETLDSMEVEREDFRGCIADLIGTIKTIALALGVPEHSDVSAVVAGIDRLATREAQLSSELQALKISPHAINLATALDAAQAAQTQTSETNRELFGLIKAIAVTLGAPGADAPGDLDLAAVLASVEHAAAQKRAFSDAQARHATLIEQRDLARVERNSAQNEADEERHKRRMLRSELDALRNEYQAIVLTPDGELARKAEERRNSLANATSALDALQSHVNRARQRLAMDLLPMETAIDADLVDLVALLRQAHHEEKRAMVEQIARIGGFEHGPSWESMVRYVANVVEGFRRLSPLGIKS